MVVLRSGTRMHQLAQIIESWRDGLRARVGPVRNCCGAVQLDFDQLPFNWCKVGYAGAIAEMQSSCGIFSTLHHGLLVNVPCRLLPVALAYFRLQFSGRGRRVEVSSASPWSK